MQWTRRRIVVASASLAAAFAAMAGLLIIRISMGYQGRLPQKVWAANDSLHRAAVSPSGQRLTVERPEKLLEVNPELVPAADRKLLSRQMHRDKLGSRPLVWLSSERNIRRWDHLPGVRTVIAKVNVPLVGLPGSILTTAEREQAISAPEVWSLAGSIYKPVARPIKTTIDPSLQAAIAADIRGSGSAVVANSRGEVQAVVGSRWSQAVPLGLAGLPPMLALALDNSSVIHELAHGAVSLSSMATVWGLSSAQSAFTTLGLGQGPFWGIASGSHMPSRMSGSVLAGTTHIDVSPAQLLRSYLPIVVDDRIEPLTLVHVASLPRAHLFGKFSTTRAQMPLVTEDSVRFRVWRPSGSYVVILSRSLGEVAVLQGSAESDMLALMQWMAEERP